MDNRREWLWPWVSADRYRNLEMCLETVKAVRDENLRAYEKADLELSKSRKECADTYEKLDDVRAGKEHFEKELRIEQQRHQATRKDGEKEIARLKPLEEEFKSVQMQRNKARHENARLTKELAQANQDVKGARDHHEVLERSYEEMKKELADCQKELNATREQRNIARKEKNRLFKELDGMKNSDEAYEATIKSFRNKLALEKENTERALEAGKKAHALVEKLQEEVEQERAVVKEYVARDRACPIVEVVPNRKVNKKKKTDKFRFKAQMAFEVQDKDGNMKAGDEPTIVKKVLAVSNVGGFKTAEEMRQVVHLLDVGKWQLVPME